MHPNTHTNKSQSTLNETMSAWASSGVKSASDQHKTPSLIMTSSLIISARSTISLSAVYLKPPPPSKVDFVFSP